MGKYKVTLKELVDDAKKSCENGLFGLLIVGDNSENLNKLKTEFTNSVREDYPVVIQSLDEFYGNRQSNIINGESYYMISLDEFEIIS
jgi:hypothetical protein